MSMKLAVWSPEKTSREVMKFYRNAQEARKRLEDQWKRNEAAYATPASTASGVDVASVTDDPVTDDIDGGIPSPGNINVAYTFKNTRFIHSQLSANPPTVAMRPASSDQEDTRKADAADRAARFALRKYQLQEKQDIMTLNTLIYGTGCVKTVLDSTLGDILEFNEETGEILTEGDISVGTPHMWNVFIDPDARPGQPVRKVAERIFMDYDEACVRWPGAEKEDLLKQVRIERTSGSSASSNVNSNETTLDEEHWNCVELVEYWETGLPSNGYLGRYAVVTAQGGVLEPCRPSPFRFTAPGARSKLLKMNLEPDVLEARLKKLPKIARLPYHFLSEIDVPNSVYGKSSLEYAGPLQETLGQIDSAYIDNIRANGVARMIVPDNVDVNLDLSNSPWDVTKTSGTQAPYYMEVPQLMPEMASSRGNMIQGINDVQGINEAMMGQQSREQSGASMQYATNQGNMIRRRLFNKYVLVTESIYRAILDLIREHWTTDRIIQVLGKEKALESISLKGADIDGGYDVVAEYGVTLSLDPMTRREEILTLQPLFEKAGIPPRVSMKMMKLNDLEGIYDIIQLAEDRQREYFDEMIASGRLVDPEPMQDHANMIQWAMMYFMTAEFKYLDEASKELCREHIRRRVQLAAQEATSGISGQAAAPAASPVQAAVAPPAQPPVAL